MDIIAQGCSIFVSPAVQSPLLSSQAPEALVNSFSHRRTQTHTNFPSVDPPEAGKLRRRETAIAFAMRHLKHICRFPMRKNTYRNAEEAVGKRLSAALPSSFVTAAYFYVRLIPQDFVPLKTTG